MFLGCPPMADIRSLTQKCFSSCCDGLVDCKFLDCLLLVSDKKYTNLTKLAVLSNFQTTCSQPFFSKWVLVLILSYENKLSFKSHAKVNLFSYEWVCTRPRFAEDAQNNYQTGCRWICTRGHSSACNFDAMGHSYWITLGLTYTRASTQSIKLMWYITKVQVSFGISE